MATIGRTTDDVEFSLYEGQADHLPAPPGQNPNQSQKQNSHDDALCLPEPEHHIERHADPTMTSGGATSSSACAKPAADHPVISISASANDAADKDGDGIADDLAMWAIGPKTWPKLRFCTHRMLIGVIHCILFVAWWFGETALDSDGDGDLDFDDVEAFLRGKGKKEIHKHRPPTPKWKAPPPKPKRDANGNKEPQDANGNKKAPQAPQDADGNKSKADDAEVIATIRVQENAVMKLPDGPDSVIQACWGEHTNPWTGAGNDVTDRIKQLLRDDEGNDQVHATQRNLGTALPGEKHWLHVKAKAKAPRGSGASRFADRFLGDGDGDFDVDDVIGSAVEGVGDHSKIFDAQEDMVVDNLRSGRARPWFIIIETVVAALLWFIGALMEVGKGIPFSLTLAGLDSFSPFFGNESNLFVLKTQDDCRDLRPQVWRWIGYQWTHVGSLHVLSNSIFNVIFGIPIEAINGTKRMILLYNMGVIGGALCCFLMDPMTPVVGMSGGCYSLLGITVSDLILNWKHKRYRKPVVVMIAVLIAFDLYQYNTSSSESKSNWAHLGGFLVGLWMGTLIGKNYVLETWEKITMGISAFLCIAFVASSIVWLVLHFPPRGIYEAETWCWHRQVFNRTMLSPTAWKCIRCNNISCVDWWTATQSFIEKVPNADCESNGWAFSGLPPNI